MNYAEVVEVSKKEKEDVVDYLDEEILSECLRGHDSCDWEISVDDHIDVPDDFVKPTLVEIAAYAIVETSDEKIEVNITASYIDTFSSTRENEFYKCNVDVTIDGVLTPDSVSFEGVIFVGPIESV